MNQNTAGSSSTIELVIDLDDSDKNTPVPVGDLVQRYRYEQLRDGISRHLEGLEIPGPRATEFPAGSGWVVFLDGTRGAGKSTFLSSVQRNLGSEADIRGRLAFVGLIDPSRIESSEIILLVILQQLGKRVADVMVADRSHESEQLRDEWRRAFRGVAGGLTLFAKEHHPLNDLDPDLFLDWGLERAGDSANLRAKLHRLFEIACRILNARALMLAFDDADTDATHAVDLLECIRKYLDTPHVMVLVTGDMELYSLLVRQHFAKTIVNKREAAIELPRRSAEGDRSAQYLRMIDHLEEQYLLKLFPIRQRMQLLPLWSLLQEADRRNVVYKASSRAWGKSQLPIDDVIAMLVKQGLRVKAGSDVVLYQEFLLKQPLRSVLQVVSHSSPHLKWTVCPGDEIESWSSDLTEALSRALGALALTSLYKFSIDTDAIAARELPALTQAIFELSLRDGDIDTASYLRPMSAEQDIKNCFAALSAEVPNFCSGEPGILLRYLFRGPGSVSLYALVRDRNRSSVSDDEGIRRFKQYVGVGRKEDALDWARRATAIIASPHGVNPKVRVVRSGVIGLNRKKPNGAGARLHTFKTAIREAVEDEKVPSFPVFALSLIDVTGGADIRTYASIFTIVGLVEKLLSQRSSDRESILSVLNKAYPSLTLSAPSWAGVGTEDSQLTKVEKDADKDKEAQKLNELVTVISDWLNNALSLSKLVSPSAVFLGKVWTRLYFSLEKAADELRKSQENFANVMEIFSLCVINAFLVEESEHHVIGSGILNDEDVQVDRTNPRTSAREFVKKLKRMSLDRHTYPMTSIVATCPLLLGLLDENEGYDEALKGLFSPECQMASSIKAQLRPTALKIHMEKVAISGSSTRGAKDEQQAGSDAEDSVE